MRARLLLDAALDTLLPQRCLACRRFGAALHAACLDALPRADGPRCGRCWAPAIVDPCPRCLETPPAYDALRARFRFAGDARRALIEAKFRGVTALLDPLAEAAAQSVPAAWTID